MPARALGGLKRRWAHQRVMKKRNFSASRVNFTDDIVVARAHAPRYIRGDEALKKVIKETLDGHFNLRVL